MPLSASSIFAAVGASVENVQFQSSAEVLPRKVLIIATYDPAKTAVIDETPVLVTSEADAGDQFGFGFMAHRLAVQAFLGSQGVETWIQPQSESGGAAAATGDIDFTGSVPVANSTIYLYVAGIPVPTDILSTDADTVIATKVVAAVALNTSLPVTAVVNGVTAGQVDFTAKSKGPWGNGISLTFNWGAKELTPTGIVAVVTDMASGTGTPDIDDALNGLGINDDQNEDFYTDIINGYGNVTTELDKLSVYNGVGNGFTGNYAKLVSRPFRVLAGDVTAGSGGLSALIAVGDGRKTDRTNGIIANPGSPNHPEEIAAMAIGIMARLNDNRAQESTIGQIMPGIIPGLKADRWTSSYSSNDTALKAGISPIVVKNGACIMQNVASFYHPDSVPTSSNGYRSMRNISIIQNFLYNITLNFSQAKWQGISIVSDVTKVSNATDREKARDIDSVIDDLLALAVSFEGHSWIFTAAFTIEKLQAGGAVAIRAGGTGFDSTLSVLLSGEGGIFDTNTQFDTSLAVLLQ